MICDCRLMVEIQIDQLSLTDEAVRVASFWFLPNGWGDVLLLVQHANEVVARRLSGQFAQLVRNGAQVSSASRANSVRHVGVCQIWHIDVVDYLIVTANRCSYLLNLAFRCE